MSTVAPPRPDAPEAVIPDRGDKTARATAHAIGVINPFALAEIKNGRRINWKGVADPRKELERHLGMPYERLFDPKHGSPLYPGIRVTDEGVAELETVPRMGIGPFAEAVGEMVWLDLGDFFEYGTDVNDAVQGAVGDCYLLAALASVAWARTYVIAEKTRRTDELGHFKDAIQLFVNGAWKWFEVTQSVPATVPGHTFIYARSSQAAEIWPAVYEKAYAQYRANTTSDTPDYSKLACGDPVAAAVHLTGLTGTYYATAALNPNLIFQVVKANSVQCKTFNPMVCWTYGTAPPGVNYTTAHIVANHAYSILGFSLVNGQQYIVLRNPWGNTEGTLNVLGGTWTAWDEPYYGGPGEMRTMTLPTQDGVFAIRVDTFKSHFAGFGVVK